MAEEVKAQAAAGLTTVLVHSPAEHLRSTSTFNPRIIECLRKGQAELALPGDHVRARVLVIRQPRVLAADPTIPLMVEADRIVMVANQPPRDAGRSRLYYRPRTIRDRIERLFGQYAEWAPIGPLVREALVREDRDFDLTPTDWHNIIDVREWDFGRDGLTGAVPVLGRFSRPDRRKWPSRDDQLLAAYPDTPDLRVRILGGGEMALERLGRKPDNWEVLPFGSMDPRAFVRTIDVFVYFHADSLIEAFGRTILEAMASGAPAILPETFRPLFGDSAIYAEPEQVAEIVHGLHADPDRYRQLSRQAIEYVESRFGPDSHVARIQDRLGDDRDPKPAPTATAPGPRSRPPRRRVMMLSSNGAGLGHITRLMSIGRRLGDETDTVIATQSQAAPLVTRSGFLAEYVPSRGYLHVDSAKWNRFLHQRLMHLIDLHDPQMVMVDGTVPYGGLIQTIRRHPDITWVWVRRAMWRPGLGKEWIRRGQVFDAILEPGEFSSEVDRGVTTRDRDRVKRVGPITYLDPSELVDRDAARAALGLGEEGPCALLQMGAGNINDIQSPAGRFAAQLIAQGVQVVVAQSPIAARPIEAPPGAHVVVEYPLSRYLKAMDFTISAAGYNSFHELIGFSIPTIFVPNAETALDDQVARVGHAVAVGAALEMRDPDSVAADRVIQQIMDPDTRAQLAQRCTELHVENGALEAARWTEELLMSTAVSQG